MRIASGNPVWLPALRRYIAAIVGGNFVWETAQLPLYTIGREGSPRAIAVAVLHCTAGDVIIGTLALVAALALFGNEAWPGERAGTVVITTVAIGVGYTVWSEYLNTVVRRTWSYAAAMPILPGLGTGLSPLAQWFIIPAAALAWAGQRAGRKGSHHE